MKPILFCFLLLSSFAVSSELKVTWCGTSCIYISDGKTDLLFDPFFTRPSFLKLITFQKISSDKQIVKKWLSKMKTGEMEAVFVSHTHYDHVFDLVEVSKQSGAHLYGSRSMKNLAFGGDVHLGRVSEIKVAQKYDVGAFTVSVLPAGHAPTLFGYVFESDVIKKSFAQPASLTQYKMGQNFNFYIKHPDGSVLFHPGGEPSDLNTFDNFGSVDLIVQGLANRKNTSSLVKKILRPLGAKVVIPVHYDNFFKPLSDGVTDQIFVNKKEFTEKVKEELPGVEVKYLKYGEPFILSK